MSEPLDIKKNEKTPWSEVSEEFLQGMVDRMSMSYYKYGPVADAYPSKVNAIKSLRLRLDKYLETGNTEFLMDVANFAMIEYMHPKHEHAHYKPTDSKESPGRVWDADFEGEDDETSARSNDGSIL